jgi:hypothetical protein
LIRPPRVTESRRRLTRAIALAVALASIGFAGTARADATAEQLFLEGRTLMQAGQYQKACEKFQASHDRDQTATGTLLNLALCHEAIGKPATAWAEYRRVAAESAGKRPDRIDLARSHEAALAPTLSYLKINVSPRARVDGLVIRLDKSAIDRATLDTEFPVDPGPHDLEASAPGKRTRVDHVSVEGPARHQVFAVEPLADAPPPPRRPEAPGARESPGTATRRTLGYVLGGAGIAGVAVGLAFGLAASNRQSDVRSLCPGDQCPNAATQADAASAITSGDRSATLSNVFIAGGGVLILSGGVLLLTTLSRGGGETRKTTARIQPGFVGIDRGGALLLSGPLE